MERHGVSPQQPIMNCVNSKDDQRIKPSGSTLPSYNIGTELREFFFGLFVFVVGGDFYQHILIQSAAPLKSGINKSIMCGKREGWGPDPAGAPAGSMTSSCSDISQPPSSSSILLFFPEIISDAIAGLTSVGSSAGAAGV